MINEKIYRKKCNYIVTLKKLTNYFFVNLIKVLITNVVFSHPFANNKKYILFLCFYLQNHTKLISPIFIILCDYQQNLCY